MIAAALASVCVGLTEGAVYGSGSAYEALAATGLLAIFAFPLGLLGAGLVRGLLAGSRIPALFASLTDDDGNAPRLAGLFAIAALAPAVLGVLAYLSIAAITARTSADGVIALGGALVISAAASVLVLLARPMTLVASGLFRAIGRRVGDSSLTPPRIALGALVLFAAALALTWLFGVRPRIGYLNIDPVYFALTFVAVLVATHIVWAKIGGRARRIVAAIAALSLVLVLAVGVHARASNPAVVLEIWASQPLAGRAADALFNERALAESRDRQAITPTSASSVRPDILLITLDTVRADSTPPYGGRVKMPALAALAERGAVFEWAFAAGNVTRRSLATIATGLSPHRVRGRQVGWALKLDPRHVVLAQRLRAGGYDTAGFAWSEKFFGQTRFGGGLDHAEFSAAGDLELAARARDWMKSRARTKRGAPLFVWVHLIEPHKWKNQALKPPSKLSPEAKRRWLYEQSLAQVDRALRVLLAQPSTNPAGRIVVLTADHGEGLGEHGASNHSTDLYNSQIRVPLIIAGPGIGAARIGEPVGHADLAPTILELAGFKPLGMPESDGRSLAGLARGERQSDPDGGFALASMVRDRSVAHRLDAVVIGRFKLIDDGKSGVELYDLEADPDELRDVASSQPAVLARLREELERRRRLEHVTPY